ncbi:hypothetical protein [Paraburkholderia hospita]|nr:hypothetical protein [Paraburkholderia hospita]
MRLLPWNQTGSAGATPRSDDRARTPGDVERNTDQTGARESIEAYVEDS